MTVLERKPWKTTPTPPEQKAQLETWWERYTTGAPRPAGAGICFPLSEYLEVTPWTHAHLYTDDGWAAIGDSIKEAVKAIERGTGDRHLGQVYRPAIRKWLEERKLLENP